MKTVHSQMTLALKIYTKLTRRDIAMCRHFEGVCEQTVEGSNELS